MDLQRPSIEQWARPGARLSVAGALQRRHAEAVRRRLRFARTIADIAPLNQPGKDLLHSRELTGCRARRERNVLRSCPELNAPAVLRAARSISILDTDMVIPFSGPITHRARDKVPLPVRSS